MIAVTCQCGRVLNAPDENAGKVGRCKVCKAHVQIPGVATTLVPPLDLAPAIPQEPWYYEFVFGVTSFSLYLGMVVGSMGAIGACMSQEWVVAGGAAGLFVASLIVLPPILLSVDVARNVRSLRYRQG